MTGEALKKKHSSLNAEILGDLNIHPPPVKGGGWEGLMAVVYGIDEVWAPEIWVIVGFWTHTIGGTFASALGLVKY